MLTKLTDWKTGNSVFVNIDSIDSMERIPEDIAYENMTARTKIVLGTDVLLVKETPDEVYEFYREGSPGVFKEPLVVPPAKVPITAGSLALSPEAYRSERGLKFTPWGCTSFITVRVLSELIGKPWNEITLAYVSAVNPSLIRVTSGIVTADAVRGRVTVFLGEDGNIEYVEQEESVSLPPSIANGYELEQALKKLKKE